MTDPTDSPPEAQAGRSRRRRNVVGNSAHREEYVRLMRAGWTSLSLERYAAYRYGEDIPASTFREYKRRQKITVADSTMLAKPFDADVVLDVLAMRQELIALQVSRISIDSKHEREMGKLFSSGRAEIQLLNTLLTDLKTDLQEGGLIGKEAERFVVDGPSPSDVPRVRTLAEAMGGATPEQERDMARVLHMVLPRSAGNAASNGHGA